MSKSSPNKTLLIAGAVGAGVLLMQTTPARRAVASATQQGPAPSAAPKPTPKSPPAAGCSYPRRDLPPAPAKTNAELVRRVVSVIKASNARAEGIALEQGYRGRAVFSQFLAESLVAAAQKYAVPLDILVAVCNRESSFRYFLADDLLRTALPTNRAVGPMQVERDAFRQVGFRPELLLGWSPHENRIRFAVMAGAAYLAWTRRQVGESWCNTLHAYYEGVTGFRRGRRNQPYVDRIIEWANSYTELRT